MPTWYRTGTIAVTNGSTTVTGTGTAWVAVVNVGDALHAPDGRSYEIAAITGNTSLTLAGGYLGSTASGQDYAIQPTRGVTVAFNDNAQALLSLIQGYVDGALSGRFPAGTAGAPSIAGAADPDTGLSFPGSNQLRFSAGGAQRALLSTAALQVDVPLTGTAVQSSPGDTTSGRVLLNGAHGLGAFDSPAATVTDGEIDLPSGFFGGSGSGTDANTFPSNNSRFAPFLNMNRRVGSGLYSSARMYFDGFKPIIRYRGNNSDPWSDGNILFGTLNAIGPVSQSGGVPTGAIIERGSNANGDYVRCADGTQICWISLGASTSGPVTWTFPAAFSTAPKIAATAATSGARFATVGNETSTSADLNAWNSDGTRSGTGCRLIAVGSWF